MTVKTIGVKAITMMNKATTDEARTVHDIKVREIVYIWKYKHG